MVKPDEVRKVRVYEERHEHYGPHSHIETNPVMKANVLFENIAGVLKESVPENCVSKREGEICVYSKRGKAGYRRRFLKITYISGKTKYHRIHIDFEHPWGRRYFFQALKNYFLMPKYKNR